MFLKILGEMLFGKAFFETWAYCSLVAVDVYAKIDCRWALQFAMIVRRCHLSIAPADLCNKLSRPSHSYGTRGQKSSFRPLRVLSHAGTVSFSNRAPLVWNSLPASLQSADSRSKFKAGFLSNCSSHSFMNSMVSLMFGSPHRI